jgi:hypothetical protein
MSIRTIALASLLALALGLGLVGYATWRVRDLERRSAALAVAGREAGASFEQTLQGEHAARQFKAFDERRAVALARVAARRDRLFGVLLAAAGALGLSTAVAFRRMAREIDEERRHLEGGVTDRAPPPGAGG